MAQKTLIVTVAEAKNLLAADKGGTSDPYCKLRVGNQNFKTKTIKKCLAPKWNESFTFKIADTANATLVIDVMDHDTFSADDPLGSISIPLGKLKKGVETAEWYNLSGVPKGSIHLKLKPVDFGVEETAQPVGQPGGPQGYQSQAQQGYPSQGAYPSQMPPGAFPGAPNPYGSQLPPNAYPPNPYAPAPQMYPPNPYGSQLPPNAYPPDPYNSNPYPPNPYAPPNAYPSMGGGYPPQMGGFPPQGNPQNPYGSQLPPGAFPPQQPGAFPPQQPGAYPPGPPPA